MKTLEILAVCVAAILTAITTYKWKDIDWIGKSALIVIILAAILVAINGYRQNKKDELKAKKEELIEKVNAKFGDIQDIEGATIPVLTFGNGATQIFLPQGVFNLEQFGPLIKLYIKNEKLHVNTIINERTGSPIAAIDDNTWTLYNDDYEYNNDDTAFELVTKAEREVYFQVELKNGFAYLAGALFNKKGEGVCFIPGQDGVTLQVIFSNSEMKLDISSIKKIFKYPRAKYYSKRIE
ncbi:MAG: hypothetical protein ACRYFA_00890 [Janthinobacterium lividum]